MDRFHDIQHQKNAATIHRFDPADKTPEDNITYCDMCGEMLLEDECEICKECEAIL